MDKLEEILFCKKRIAEQKDYLADALAAGKKQEYLDSAFAIQAQFEKRLRELQPNSEINKIDVRKILLELYEEIKHGDEEHQTWLLEKIESFIIQRDF